MSDNVNHPKHYQLDGLDIEVVDVIKSVLGAEKFEGYCRGNIIKYITRADKKNELEDLKKAMVYLKWEIASKERATTVELKNPADSPYVLKPFSELDYNINPPKITLTE